MKPPSLARDKIPFAMNPMGDLNKPVGAPQTQERSLEFVVHYLDRIESHLDRIATALELGADSERLRLQLMNMEAAILKAAGKAP